MSVKSAKGFGTCTMCGVAQGKAENTGETARHSEGPDGGEPV
jgi:hypothetical protein